MELLIQTFLFKISNFIISYSRYQEMVPHFNFMQFSDNNNVQTENTILVPFQSVLTQHSQSNSNSFAVLNQQVAINQVLNFEELYTERTV